MSVHLYTRSSYSILTSTIRIKELVQYAKNLGYTSVALTDHNVMFAAASFIDACKKEGIHPIVGMEVDCMYHDMIVPFVLLCKDNKGYQQLMVLSSFLNEKEKTCSLEQLQSMLPHCHLIAFSEGGFIDSEMVKDDGEGIREKLQIMKNDLQDFDISLSYQEASLWKNRNAKLKRIAQSLHIPTVAINKIYYLRKEDSKAHRILRGMLEKKTIQDASLTEITGRYFLTKQEMEALYDIDDLQRTDEIARLCKADYCLEKTTLPEYPIKNNVDAYTYLVELCKVGLKKRLHGQYKKEYVDRLQYELSVIHKMHFENYFLIVYDFICQARKNDINIGPGRGSAAGSLVAYCLGITMIDPLQYGLLFERFLNPERISMPDIDTDIPDNKRKDVIDYVYQKYGRDHVCNIITFGTLGPRLVIREAAKVLGMFERDVDMITKLIPNTPKMTLEKAYASSAHLRTLIASEKKFQNLFEMSQKIEGLPHHFSVHAAGVIMCKDNINAIVPTICFDHEMKTSQYSMEYLEERGLIKMDFLGLRNLSVIHEIVQKVIQQYPSFQLSSIPLDDAKTYSMFANANTLGVFQFESEGIKNLLRQIKPQNLNEIADAMALYRPGPMDNISLYLKHKNDPSSIPYLNDAVRSCLKKTYGIMIYQEQIMKIAQTVASFSLGKADILRKAISKKKEDEMKRLKKDFLSGAAKNGYSLEDAEKLFNDIEKFAGYGFNKSHAIAYSLIAYQMAYLKANYAYIFYISVLNNVISDSYKTSLYIDECRRRGISVYYPSINESEIDYQRKEKGILLPLSVVKAIGTKTASEIVNERKNNGPYTDIYDFVARVRLHNVNQSQMESLIDAGACDCLNETRTTLKAVLPQAISYAGIITITKDGRQTLNPDLVSKQVYTRKSDNEEIRQQYERNALGFTLSRAFIIQFREKNNIHVPSIASLLSSSGKIVGFAQIKEARKHRTKKGTMMAFLKLADETGEMRMMVMPRQYEMYSSSLMQGVYILFHAKIQMDGSVICDSIQFFKTT